jgi:hypothetical protein
MNKLMIWDNCLYSFYVSYALFMPSLTKMTKVCPSRPSSRDHYILSEIMFRRTKVPNQ